jgi:hypothetical protein
MRYEVPDPHHQLSVDAKIVRIEVEAPRLEHWVRMTKSAIHAQKRRADALEEGGHGSKQRG